MLRFVTSRLCSSGGHVELFRTCQVSRGLYTNPALNGDTIGSRHRSWTKKRENGRVYFMKHFEENGFAGTDRELSDMFDKIGKEGQELFCYVRNKSKWRTWIAANDLAYLYGPKETGLWEDTKEDKAPKKKRASKKAAKTIKKSEATDKDSVEQSDKVKMASSETEKPTPRKNPRKKSDDGDKNANEKPTNKNATKDPEKFPDEKPTAKNRSKPAVISKKEKPVAKKRGRPAATSSKVPQEKPAVKKRGRPKKADTAKE